ncbi:MAG: hypothetical protein LUE99_01905 [Bacteroides sp.]|nr:hypothetical protein [Bacteroides sp.]
MVLALFSKESGIVWLAVTPVLSLLIIDEKAWTISLRHWVKLLFKYWSISFLIIIVYFIFRIVLSVSSLDIGVEDNNYTVGLGLNSIKGLFLLWGSSLTCLDTIAIFIEKCYWLFLITLTVSLIFLFVIGRKIKIREKDDRIKLLVLVGCAFIVTTPHLVMGHPGKMHAYPTLWMFALSLGILLNDANWEKWERNLTYLFLLTSLAVFLHKWYYIYENGKCAYTRVKSAVEQTMFVPNHICVIDCDEERIIYSVFQTTGALAWDMANATRLYFDFINPQQIDYKCINVADKNKIVEDIMQDTNDIDCIWVVENDKVGAIDVCKK